jgi:hypothetical protein
METVNIGSEDEYSVTKNINVETTLQFVVILPCECVYVFVRLSAGKKQPYFYLKYNRKSIFGIKSYSMHRFSFCRNRKLSSYQFKYHVLFSHTLPLCPDDISGSNYCCSVLLVYGIPNLM